MASSRFLTAMAACVFLAVLSGCQMPGMQRLFYVDSYHPSHASTDALMEGIYEVVADSKARLDVFFLDTKRYPQPEAMAAKVEEALAVIYDVRPEAIIVSGDNAVQLLMAEHLQDGPIPCVFCAADWTGESNDLPSEFVTGIQETPPVQQLAVTLKQSYPDARRVVVLSGEAALPRECRDNLDAFFSESGLTVTYASVRTYEEWRTRFLRASSEADAILLATNRGIANWDDADAEGFVREHIRVPVFTCDASMMKVAVFGLSAAGREQGRWAARTALRILRGKSPANIPVTQAQQTNAYINTILADKIGFEPDEALLGRCHRVE